MDKVLYTVQGDVAVLRLNNPPLNTIDWEVRRDLLEAVDQAEKNPAVRAIIIIGSDGVFSVGADVHELLALKVYKEPSFQSLCMGIEACRKPVISAIEGMAFGGGFEIPLASHYRLAKRDTKVGQLEITMGIHPGGGATQRLPRLVGIEKASNIMLSGRPVKAGDLKDTGIFDGYIDGDLLAGALAFAQQELPVKRTRDKQIAEPLARAYLEYLKQAVKGISRNNPAPAQLVELMLATLDKPFASGIDLESESVQRLSMTPESKAKQHLFLAEKAVWKVPDVPGSTPLREIKQIGIVGSGVMATGLAIVFLNAGLPVTLMARSKESAEKALGSVQKHFGDSVKKGKLNQQQADQFLSNLKGTVEYGDLANEDLIIEAALEDMAVKTEIFQQLDAIAKPGAILATNTSTLDLDKIAEAVKRPQDIIGMHFFNPAPMMKLLEVVRADKTANDVIATVMDLCKRIKKTAVLSKVCDGFIGNRILFTYQAATLRLVEEGASPQEIDKALEKWGMALGPFKMQDIIGLDLLASIRQRQYAENPDAIKDVIGDKLFANGRLGQKNGKGWYKYEPGARTGVVDPDVTAEIEKTRQDMGTTPRKIDEEEILERCLFAIINEGAKILEEGIALRASDIDVVYVYGYGFPAHRGGPMFYADMVSPLMVVRGLERYGVKPAEILSKLAAEQQTFNMKSLGE